MKRATRVRITLLGGNYWEIKVKPKALEAVNGLPASQTFRIERKLNELQKEHILIRPYYRRIINGQLNIFAVQEMPPKKGKS